MKLLTILATNLKEWPLDFDDLPAKYVTQDDCGLLNYADRQTVDKKDLEFNSSDKRWSSYNMTYCIHDKMTLADDYSTAIVNKEEWEQEKIRLNSENVEVCQDVAKITAEQIVVRVKEIDLTTETLKQERENLVADLLNKGLILSTAVTVEKEHEAQKVEKGSVLRIKDRKYGHEFDIGSHVRVIYIDNYDEQTPYNCLDFDNCEWWVGDDEIEVVSY